MFMYFFFFSSRRRHTRCALVTGVQTCALPILLAEWQKNVPEKDAFTVAALSRVVEIRNASADEINRLVCTGNGHDSLYAAALAPEREGTSPAVELYAHHRIVDAFGPRRNGFDPSPADFNELMRRFWSSTDKLYHAKIGT